MTAQEKVNLLLVDDQPGKLMSYEVILKDLGENLIMAGSAREALEQLLKTDIAVILLDVSMPELDGFQLASMIRDHPRFQKTSIIFISAIQVEEVDRLRGYEVGAVDYVPVPVVPEVLRAKVRIFLDLYRKTRELERLNVELEHRVAERTAELETSTDRLRQSESRRNLALSAAQMGSWNLDLLTGEHSWDEGQCRIFGVDPETFTPTPENVRAFMHPEDIDMMSSIWARTLETGESAQVEYRIQRASGEVRWVFVSAAATLNTDGKPVRISGVTLDITERKEAEQRQSLLAREVDHRARNTLAVVQSILRLTRAESVPELTTALEGRVRALARAHTLLSNTRWQGADLARLVSEEMDPYRSEEGGRVVTDGPTVLLRPAMAQAFALVLHELATNAAKYGALSVFSGRLVIDWELLPDRLVMHWTELGGPPAAQPSKKGFGTRVVVATIERELGGEAAFDWRSEGLHCTLSVPRTEVAERRPAPRAAVRTNDNGATNGQAQAMPVGGRRVLLVEDEALVAIMMRDMLTDLGFSVVGPVSNNISALAAVRQSGVDCAVLDLNLGGATSYPVADELSERGIPFVFVTGYDREAVDRRYAQIPMLQKPVDDQSLKGVLASCLGSEDAREIAAAS